MSTLLVPTVPGTPFHVVKARLEGRDFLLHLSWNQREERWHLSIHDDEDTPILAGIKLVTNWPLLRHYHFDLRVPPGELMAADLTRDGSPAALDELGIGKRVELTYFESAP
jgi:hypothetical protein